MNAGTLCHGMSAHARACLSLPCLQQGLSLTLSAMLGIMGCLTFELMTVFSLLLARSSSSGVTVVHLIWVLGMELRRPGSE